MSYNGYKNYPTWNLNLWMDNDYSTYKHYHDELRNLDSYELAERIKEDVEMNVEENVKASGDCRKHRGKQGRMMKIGVSINTSGADAVVLKVQKKEMAANLAETFAKFAQDYMDDGMWEEAEECLYITNKLNRKEFKDVRTNDL